MAEPLLSKGYEVFGLVRRSSVEKFDRIEALMDDIKLVEGDLTDQSSLDSVIHSVQPDEVYNLATQSFVPVSWDQPVLTGDVTGLGVIRGLRRIDQNDGRSGFGIRTESGERQRICRFAPKWEWIIKSRNQTGKRVTVRRAGG